MRIHVHIPDKLHENLKVLAAKTKRTMKSIIVEILEARLKQEKCE
jgi:predicted DNA-binding protein